MPEEVDGTQDDGDDYYTFLNISRNVRKMMLCAGSWVIGSGLLVS